MTSDDMLSLLLAERAAFLRFLERRVGNPATAEDLLQDALLKSVQRVDAVRDPQALVGWFYRVLENAALDHHRRHATSTKALDRVQQEVHGSVVETDDAPARVCGCVAKLKAGLKKPYAEALDRVDVEDMAVKDYAEEAGISRSNAGVRLHRARQALRQEVERTCGHCAEQGCTDCTC